MIPQGFRFASANAGVKSPEVKRHDVGLVLCTDTAVISGVFTRNKVKAAPVLIGMEQVERGCIRAVIANSGNANACTGNEGIEDAQNIMASLASKLGMGIEKKDVLPMSTGVIGQRLPAERIIDSFEELIENISDNAESFARAIMTTDTFPKISTKTAGNATVTGIAKGSGMISPDMATTLAVVLTDAKVAKKDLDRILRNSIESSFNAVTVDGDTSTNDTLVCLSSSKVEASLADITVAIDQVIHDLAIMVVSDGEGATKLVRINLKGAGNDAEAKTAAKAVANSPLVKTAMFGSDPNWGRIIAAVGYSGVEFVPGSVDIDICSQEVVRSGMQSPGYSEATLQKKMKSRTIEIDISIGDGPGNFTVWTTDLSYDYVKINADYRT